MDFDKRGPEWVERIRSKYKYHMAPGAKVGIAGSMCADQQIMEASRHIELIINTDDIDSQYEVVMPGGMDRTYLDKNKKVFLDHEYVFKSAVGAIRWINPLPDAVNTRAWKALVFVLDKPGDPTGDQILYTARECGIGASVGFEELESSRPSKAEVDRYKEAGKEPPDNIVRRWKAMEFSFTCFPCNVACQGGVVEASGLDSRMNAMDALVTKGRVTREFADRMGFPCGPRRKMFPAAGGGTVVEPKKPKCVTYVFLD